MQPRFYELGLPWIDVSLSIEVGRLLRPPEGGWYAEEAVFAMDDLEGGVRGLITGAQGLWMDLELSAGRYAPTAVRFGEIIEDGLRCARHMRSLLEDADQVRTFFRERGEGTARSKTSAAGQAECR